MMKEWPGGSYLVIKITPKVPGGRPLMAIGYKCNSRKVLGYIATKGGVSTESGDPYSSHFPKIYYNVSVIPVVCPHVIVRYFNDCNSIDNHNMM